MLESDCLRVFRECIFQLVGGGLSAKQLKSFWPINKPKNRNIVKVINKTILKRILLGVCDYGSSSYGAAQCQNLEAACQGSAYSVCAPYLFWGSVSTGYFSVVEGALHGPYSNVTTHAFSARCVRSWKFVLTHNCRELNSYRQL